MFTVLGSNRTHDLGIEANTPNSGYDRLLLASGDEIRLWGLRYYARRGVSRIRVRER